MDIILTTNSPGELNSFVKPIVATLSETIPSARIILIITPCQYASGKEIEVARTFKGLYEIILPQEYNSWILKNRPPQGINFSKEGAILFLGGDMISGLILSRKLNYKAFAYTMDRFAWVKSYTQFFVPDDRIYNKGLRKKVPKDKIKIVGDLIGESVESKAKASDYFLDPKHPIITFLPGSRSMHSKFLAPFFLDAARLIKNQINQAQFVFGLSPFTSASSINDHINNSGQNCELVNRNGLKYLKFSFNFEILLIESLQYDAMNIADLIVTVPGTNTLEAAALGKPMLVIVPFNNTDVYIFEGILGILSSLPIAGKFIKKMAVFIYNKTTRFLALPNIKAQKMIVPELRGILKPEYVANKALQMISDWPSLKKISKDLIALTKNKGAALKISQEIAYTLK